MKRRSAFRRLRKSVRRVFITKPFMWIGVRVAPAMYMAYMRFVWASSRVDDGGAVERFDIVQQYGGLVGMFWHEEVIASPYAYHRFGIHPHTLINMSDVGELITRIAERCHFIVFRGGSSSRRSRRRSRVFRDMIDHMNKNADVVYGVAVDGSHGPAYRVKRGPVVIARECGKPIILARLWFARCLRLPTWDRTALPLPFNRIRLYYRGPYFVPDDARTKAGLERFRLELENDLIDLAATSYRDMRQPVPPNLVRDERAQPLRAS